MSKGAYVLPLIEPIETTGNLSLFPNCPSLLTFCRFFSVSDTDSNFRAIFLHFHMYCYKYAVLVHGFFYENRFDTLK